MPSELLELSDEVGPALRVGIADQRADHLRVVLLGLVSGAIEVGDKDGRVILHRIAVFGRRDRAVPFAGQHSARITGRQLLVALDATRGVDRESALRLEMLVLARLRRGNREKRLVVLALRAEQVLLAGAPAAKRHANRSGQRDVERDPQLDVLAALLAEIARRNDRIFG